MAEKWLVIDDSATIQRVIKLAFQDYDVQITEADSTQEAMRELFVSPASLVIVDAALAGVQSVHDFSRIQESSPQSAFVILEGSYDHIDENQFRGAGFRHFLKKPFDAAQLIAITREALGRAIPLRYHDEEGGFSKLPVSFALSEDSKVSPPPPPSMMVGRSYHEDVSNPFGSVDSFDLGLERTADKGRSNQEGKAEPYGADTYKSEVFNPDQFKAKPYLPEAADEGSFAPEKPFSPTFSLGEDYSHQSQDGSYIVSPLNGMLEPMLQEEMAKLIRQSVDVYCRKHFAELAREFLQREIDKLTQERSRLLVDK